MNFTVKANGQETKMSMPDKQYEAILDFIKKTGMEVEVTPDKDDMGFTMNDWNVFLKKVNQKVIDLDGQKELQNKFIFETRQIMVDKGFNILDITSWYKSQCQLCGMIKAANMFDFSALYPPIELNNCLELKEKMYNYTWF